MHIRYVNQFHRSDIYDLVGKQKKVICHVADIMLQCSNVRFVSKIQVDSYCNMKAYDL